MKKNLITVISVAMAVLSGNENAAVNNSAVFIQGLESENFWTQIHAAEYMIECDIPDIQLQKWQDNAEKCFGDTPVKRIGVWRVKALDARSCGNNEEFQQVIGKLKKVAFSPNSPDRIHALETLFKLKIKLLPEESAQLKSEIQDEKPSSAFRIYGAGLLGLSDTSSGEKILLEEFTAAAIGSTEKFLTIFIWKNYPSLSDTVLTALQAALDSKQYDEEMQIAMSGILLQHGRINSKQLFLLTDKFQSDGSELLRLAVKYAPEKASEFIKQCAASNDIELRMLATWAEIKIANMRDTK